MAHHCAEVQSKTNKHVGKWLKSVRTSEDGALDLLVPSFIILVPAAASIIFVMQVNQCYRVILVQ
jgi:hypothetical protein